MEPDTERDEPPVQAMTIRLTVAGREALDEIVRTRGLRYVSVAIDVLAREELARLRSGERP